MNGEKNRFVMDDLYLNVLRRFLSRSGVYRLATANATLHTSTGVFKISERNDGVFFNTKYHLSRLKKLKTANLFVHSIDSGSEIYLL